MHGAPQAIGSHLLDIDPDPGVRQRALADVMARMVHHLRLGHINIPFAEQELFNLDVYQFAKRADIDARLLEALEWGMELDDVQPLGADHVEASLDAIARLCTSALADLQVAAA
jgi:hypothetical protein